MPRKGFGYAAGDRGRVGEDGPLNVRMGIGSTSAIKEAIEAGLGFSILSRETIRLELEGGYLAVAEGIVIPRRLSIVCYPSAAMSLVEQAFHDYLLGVRERYGMPREVSAERRSASPPLSLRVLSEREDPISDSGGDGEATLGGAYRIRRVYRKLVKMRGRKYYTGSRCL